MPSLIVAKDLELEKVQKRGIVSVPGDMAKLRCNGAALNDFPLKHRHLQQVLLEAAKQFVARQQVRGFAYYQYDGMHVYGPYPSYEFKDTMLTGDEFALRDSGDPRLAAQLVRQRATSIEAFADYLLVANFITKPVLTEVPVKESHGSATGST